MAQVKSPAGEAIAVARQHKSWLGLDHDMEMVRSALEQQSRDSKNQWMGQSPTCKA